MKHTAGACDVPFDPEALPDDMDNFIESLAAKMTKPKLEEILKASLGDVRVGNTKGTIVRQPFGVFTRCSACVPEYSPRELCS